MFGKRFSHTWLSLVGAMAFGAWMVPSTAGAHGTDAVSDLQYFEDSPVPSWCHYNLQMLSEPTHWFGYRNVTFVRRKFDVSAVSPFHYRAFAADDSIYIFSEPISSQTGVNLEAFLQAKGAYGHVGETPEASFLSVRRYGNSLQVLFWFANSVGLSAIRGNDPANPQRHGQVSLDPVPSDLFVQWRENLYTIYTANRMDSIRVYQLPQSNWITLEERGTFDTPGDAHAFVFRDSLLYVADGIAGIEVVDVTHLDSLFSAGHCDTRGPAKHVCLVDSARIDTSLEWYGDPLLAVAEWDSGVEILDIASADSIFPIGWVDTPGRAHQVAVADSFLYVADWDGGLRVYNFARPESIVLHGFYGIGGEFHSVAVADTLVFAGDHSGLRILRMGDDWLAPQVTSAVTQTPYLRDYLRLYVLASECLTGPPVVRHLTVPRHILLEDYEDYADNVELTMAWQNLNPSGSISLDSTAFEGDQAMRLDFTVDEAETAWVRLNFAETEDWRLVDRLAFYYRGEADTVGAVVAVRVETGTGTAIDGEAGPIAADWQEYALDLRNLTAREDVVAVRLGVAAALEDTTVTSFVSFDRLSIGKVYLDTAKGPHALCQGDTVDIDVAPVSEKRLFYSGEFQLVAADTGYTNALLVSATDNSGNVSSTLTEYRAQLVVPGEGGVLRSPDSRLALHVPPGATRTEAFFFIIPKSARAAESMAAVGLDRLPGFPEGARLIGRPYDVGFTERDLLCPVDLVFRVDRDGTGDLNPHEIGVYKQDGDDWLYVGGVFDSDTRTVRASLFEAGTVVVLADPNRPESERPGRLDLKSYPNPFNPSATISYSCPTRGRVILDVYDVKGRLVRNLVDGERDAGLHFVAWNGRADGGAPVTSGIYFASLTAGGETRSVKLVLIR